MGEEVGNLYVHFPFCRRKCTYCSLYSRAGSTPEARAAYVARLAEALSRLPATALSNCRTIYFGGGSPALCDLRPMFEALAPLIDNRQPTAEIAAEPPDYEFTVELHPLDVTHDTLEMLKDGGVNRISMGVQSLDDGILRHMGRGYTVAEARRAFALVRSHFDNAGIDLIVGYPGDEGTGLATLADWGLRHCSVYSLQNDRGLKDVPDDDVVLDRIRDAARFLKSIGLERYEISNYAVPGYECRHNLAVWRGEDYFGIGEGACGRVGLVRTRSWRGDGSGATESVSPDEDEAERRIFSLRTREGLDSAGHPEWDAALERFAAEGIVVRAADGRWRLTERGTEVCDTVLAELV